MTVKIDQFDQQTGIRTRVHETETKLVIEKTYDAQPFLDAAAEMRAVTTGMNWGPLGRHVGFIPMADLGHLMRQDGSFDTTRVKKYLKDRPKLVTFDRYLKTN